MDDDEMRRQRDELLVALKIVLRVIDNLPYRLAEHQQSQVGPQRRLVEEIERRLQ